VLGYTSVLADNISSNVVGLFLGAVFRFVLYRYWVFSPTRRARAEVPVTTGAVPVSTGSLRVPTRPERGLVTER